MTTKADPDVPAPTVYEGPSGIARDSVWLTHADLPADRTEHILRIEAVHLRKGVKFQKETKEQYLSLRFYKAKRELGLNTTNRKVLEKLFGTNCADWAGKWVTLYVDHEIKSFGGEIVSGIRIRARHTKAPSGAAAAAPNQPEAAGRPEDNPMLTSSKEAEALRGEREPGDEP